MPEAQTCGGSRPAGSRDPDFGTGRTTVRHVVFVPGLNNSSSVWREVIGALSPDLAGIAVDCPPLEDVDAVAGALLAGLPDRFVAVGHSFGGYVVMAMLAQQPGRLAGAVLVNTGDNADTPEQAEARVAKAREACAGDYEAMAMAQVHLAYHPEHVGDDELMAKRLAGVREYGAARYAAHAIACSRRPDRSGVLAATDVPLLVLAADDDRVIPTAAQRRMAERIGAPFRIVETAGHMLPAEQPRALAREIADFVAGL